MQFVLTEEFLELVYKYNHIRVYTPNGHVQGESKNFTGVFPEEYYGIPITEIGHCYDKDDGLDWFYIVLEGGVKDEKSA